MTLNFLGLLRRPRELVERPQLEPEVRRSIRESWVCDAPSVRSRPRLRKPPELRDRVPAGDTPAALRQLDAGHPGAA